MPTKEEIVKFSMTIESLAKKNEISYMDAIIHHCHQTGLEFELAGKLISGPLRDKIQLEAEDLNFLPKSTTNKLPV